MGMLDNSTQFLKDDAGRRRVGYFSTKPSMVKPEFKQVCDINNIIAKYRQTGLLEHVSRYQGSYSDVVIEGDLHTAMISVVQAEEAFLSLPSNIRKKFHNDPSEFLDFVNNSDNFDEMVKLGLANPRDLPVEKGKTPSAGKGSQEGVSPSPVPSNASQAQD